jgi:hypothetical protein
MIGVSSLKAWWFALLVLGFALFGCGNRGGGQRRGSPAERKP